MVLNDASDALQGWRNAIVMGGGNGGTARAAVRLGGFIGSDVGGIGRGLNSGYGAIAAAGAGVNPFGGPFGDMNYNEKGLKVLDYIRKAANFNQARQRAELANTPEAASVYLLNPNTYNRLRSTQEGSATTGNLKNQAEMQANLEILKDAYSQVEVALAGPAIGKAANLMAGLADIFTMLNKAGGLVGPAINGAEQLLGPLKGVIDMLELLGLIGGGSGKDDSHKKAINENTDALDNLTRSLNQNVTGGGPNAQNAIGKGMNPNNPGYQVKYGIPA
jgi:hypothetical protein